MENETLRMQFLSGVITEGQYKIKLQENAEKASLNESMIGGIVGVGAINQIPSRAKTDYEMAFEHFLGERYTTNFDNSNQDLEEGKEEIRLSNEILDFLEERGMIDPSDAQKIHKDLTAFLGEKFEVKPNRERDDIKDINKADDATMEEGKEEDLIDEEKEEVEENIHNTAQMGGILGGRNFSAEAEEDKEAVFQIKALIKSGVSKEEAIQQVSDKYRLRSDYLSRKYDLYVPKEEEVEEGKEVEEKTNY